MLSFRGKNSSNGSFNWSDALIDAGISAGLTFCTTLGGQAATGLFSRVGVIAAGIAAATQFFLVLAIKRGIREKE